MRYSVILHKEEGSDYGVTVPDIAGCFSAGATVDEALKNAYEAIDGHLELLAEDGVLAPQPAKIDTHMNNEEYDDGIWAFVDIDISPYLGKTEKVNVTLPSLLVKKIDNAVAAGQGRNRSAFLADCASNMLSTG